MRVVILSFWKRPNGEGAEESRASRFQERERLRNKSFLLLPNFVKELMFFSKISKL